MLPRKNEKGFTLIELTIVMAILGILAMIAVPNYREYIRKQNGIPAEEIVQTKNWEGNWPSTWETLTPFHLQNMEGKIVGKEENLYYETWKIVIKLEQEAYLYSVDMSVFYDLDRGMPLPLKP